MARKGVLIVISGFAGSGKGTLMNMLLSQYDNYALSVSATTRAPRPGEEHGVHYFFVSREEFEQMIQNDELFEHAQYVSNYYGTPRKYVEQMLESGKDVILEIEMQGALQVKEKYPDTILLFVMPPSVQEVYNRLKKRGTETEEVIRERMKRGSIEAQAIEKYDYLLINDDLDTCLKQMHGIIQSAHFEASRNIDTIEKVKEQFNDFLS